MAQDVIATSTLKRGTIIKASDITLVSSQNQQDLARLDDFIGKELKRTVYEGKSIQNHQIGAPVLIRRNSRVSMTYTFGLLEISAWGRALNEGGEGEVINIMNLESRKKVTGVILPSGKIRVAE